MSRHVRPSPFSPRIPRVLFLFLLGIGVVATQSCATAPFQHRESVDAQFEALWSVWTDVEQWPTWDTELESASLDGPFANGTTGTLRPKEGAEAQFTLQNVDPKRGYDLVTSLPGGTLVVERWAEREGTVLMVTHRVSFKGASAGIFSSLLADQFREALPTVMRKLTAKVVKEASATSAGINREQEPPQ